MFYFVLYTSYFAFTESWRRLATSTKDIMTPWITDWLTHSPRRSRSMPSSKRHTRFPWADRLCAGANSRAPTRQCLRTARNSLYSNILSERILIGFFYSWDYYPKKICSREKVVEVLGALGVLCPELIVQVKQLLVAVGRQILTLKTTTIKKCKKYLKTNKNENS